MAANSFIVLTLLAIAGGAHAGKLSVLVSEYSDGSGDKQISVLDPQSGIVDANPRTLKFPPVAPGSEWVLSNGTHGQTSTVFPINQTVFFLAQVSDGKSLTNATLFTSFSGVYEDLEESPWFALGADMSAYPDTPFAIGHFPQMDGHSILEMNVAWDHTCNVLVVAPGGKEHLNATLVSEYDSAERAVPGFSSPPADCPYPMPADGCWRRVQGLSVVDGPRQEAAIKAPNPNYDHCDNCSFYSLEEQLGQDGQPVPGAPRRLLARGVMDGHLHSNQTDPAQLLSLEFLSNGFGPSTLPNDGALIGVGVCCELSWCPPECEGLGGHASLVGWFPGLYSTPSVLAVAPALADAQTAQLGIALDARYQEGQSMRASLMAGGQVFSFNITAQPGDYPLLSAQPLETSPKTSNYIYAWWYSGF